MIKEELKEKHIRIIKVKECTKCPYHTHKGPPGPDSCFCRVLRKTIIVEDLRFPKECPLDW